VSDIAGGVCYVTANGRRLEIGTSVNYGPSDFEREASRGLSGRLKVVKRHAVPFIEVEITTYGEVSLKELGELENVTATLECANGKTYVLTKAHQVGALEGDANEGTLTLRLEGETMKEA
jgi:hypothetical protein